jgi:glucose/arabinose dehydrogenase
MRRSEHRLVSNANVVLNIIGPRQVVARTMAIVGLVSLVGAYPALAQDGTGGQGWDPQTFDIAFEPYAQGFERPVFMADSNDGSGRLFVVEQGGLIRIVLDGEVLAQPFLDLTGQVETSGSEQGLLSMAFDPDYAENGRFYVGYTGLDSTNVFARFEVSAEDPNIADADSERVLISVADPYRNHNGGLVAFGPDGYLYAGLGDGGSGGDPEENAQDVSVLLGKILRLDVSGDFDSDEPAYRIPDDNPFVNQDGAAPEIWAYGFRNPWRFSFDREYGDLYIGDVGQNAWEEINFQPADSTGGENYGWNLLEGTHCYPEGADCDPEGTVLPVAEYGHDLGYSVTGGYVYRGESAFDLVGVYIFADYGSGNVWGLARDGSGAWQTSEPVETDLRVSSFSEDASGELYVTSFDGTVYRVVAP